MLVVKTGNSGTDRRVSVNLVGKNGEDTGYIYLIRRKSSTGRPISKWFLYHSRVHKKRKFGLNSDSLIFGDFFNDFGEIVKMKVN